MIRIVIRLLQSLMMSWKRERSKTCRIGALEDQDLTPLTYTDSHLLLEKFPGSNTSSAEA